MAGAIINRSLSRKELEILITINALYFRKFPWISTRISDALIKNQPKLESQQCKIAKQQLQKVYEKNNSYLQTINSFLDPVEQLTSLANYSQETGQEYTLEQAEKIHREESISVNLIGDTLLKALKNESKKKLSNETVDAIILLSQSGKVSKTTEVVLLEVAQENRPKGRNLQNYLSVR